MDGKRHDFLPNKLNKYSIRKYTVGTTSILVGSILFLGHYAQAQAAEKEGMIQKKDSNETSEASVETSRATIIIFESNQQGNPIEGNDSRLSEHCIDINTGEITTTETLTTEIPVKESNSTEESIDEASTLELPTTEQPSTEAPSTEQPTTEAPSMEVSAEKVLLHEKPEIKSKTIDTPKVIPTDNPLHANINNDSVKQPKSMVPDKVHNSLKHRMFNPNDTFEDKEIVLPQNDNKNLRLSIENKANAVKSADIDFKKLVSKNLMSDLQQPINNDKQSEKPIKMPKENQSSHDKMRTFVKQDISAVKFRGVDGSPFNVNNLIYSATTLKPVSADNKGEKASIKDHIHWSSAIAVDNAVQSNSYFTVNISNTLNLDKGGSDEYVAEISDIKDSKTNEVIAKSSYDSNKKLITYTFTDYVDKFQDIKMQIEKPLYINSSAISKSTADVPLFVTVGNTTTSVTNPVTPSLYEESGDVNLGSKFTEIVSNAKSLTEPGYYKQTIYVNPLDKNLKAASLEIKTSYHDYLENIGQLNKPNTTIEIFQIPNDYKLSPSYEIEPSELLEVTSRYYPSFKQQDTATINFGDITTPFVVVSTSQLKAPTVENPLLAQKVSLSALNTDEISSVVTTGNAIQFKNDIETGRALIPEKISGNVLWNNNQTMRQNKNLSGSAESVADNERRRRTVAIKKSNDNITTALIRNLLEKQSPAIDVKNNGNGTHTITIQNPDGTQSTSIIKDGMPGKSVNDEEMQVDGIKDESAHSNDSNTEALAHEDNNLPVATVKYSVNDTTIITVPNAYGTLTTIYVKDGKSPTADVNDNGDGTQTVTFTNPDGSVTSTIIKREETAKEVKSPTITVSDNGDGTQTITSVQIDGTTTSTVKSNNDDEAGMKLSDDIPEINHVITEDTAEAKEVNAVQDMTGALSIATIANNENGSYTITIKKPNGTETYATVTGGIDGKEGFNSDNKPVTVEVVVIRDMKGSILGQEIVFRDTATGIELERGRVYDGQSVIDSNNSETPTIETTNVYDKTGHIIGVQMVVKDQDDAVIGEHVIYNSSNGQSPTISSDELNDKAGNLVGHHIRLNDGDGNSIGEYNIFNNQENKLSYMKEMDEKNEFEANTNSKDENTKHDINIISIINKAGGQVSINFSNDTSAIIESNTEKIINDVNIDSDGELIVVFNDETSERIGSISQLNETNNENKMSLLSSIIDRNGHLVITYTDGMKFDLGKVTEQAKRSVMHTMVNDKGELVVIYSNGVLVI